MDNDLVERLCKIPSLGRKNFLCLGNERGSSTANARRDRARLNRRLKRKRK